MKIIKKIPIFLMVIIMFFLLIGCDEKTIIYEGKSLPDAMVGVEYETEIGYATGLETEMQYTLKEGSKLPKGLQIENGNITGIPEEAVENYEFTVLASSENKNKEASFTITIKEGQIVFEDAIVEIIIGKEDSGTIDIATGAPNITYEIIEGAENIFDGLTIEPDGRILGSYDRLRTSRPIVVMASAPHAKSATATIQIKAIYDYLTYNGSTLADAKVGLNYAASVATISNDGIVAKYTVHEDSVLPEGLTLNSDGTITGVPTQVRPGVPFKVVAKASGFSDTVAEFKIDVILNHVSVAQSKIINFGKENEDTILSVAYDGQFYVNQRGVQGNALSLNNNALTFSLVEGAGELPPGLILYENGAIIGLPTIRGEYIFSIKASALGTEDVIRTFKINVQGTQIKYNAQTLLLTKGEEVNIDVGNADVGDGIIVTYTMTDAARQELLDKWGLSLSEDGILTGIPKKSQKSMNFQVTANAEGFTSTTATIFVRIQESLVATKKFEAEYMNLIGKSGTGYSGSPTEEAMISESDLASNGAFINYLHNDNIELEFVIWADEATSNAVLYIAFGSELGTITLKPNEVGIYVYDTGDPKTGNKTQIQYAPITVDGSNGAYTSFNRYRIGNITLVKGYNVIQIAIHSNTYKQGGTGGPGIDYIEIETDVILKWHPCLYNIVE